MAAMPLPVYDNDDQFALVGFVRSTGLTPTWLTPLFWNVNWNQSLTDEQHDYFKSDLGKWCPTYVQSTQAGTDVVVSFCRYDIDPIGGMWGNKKQRGCADWLQHDGWHVEFPREYLSALSWIGCSGVDSFFADFHKEMSEKWFYSGVGRPITFAFLFSQGDVVFGDRKHVSSILANRWKELELHPFVAWEVADFIQSEELKSRTTRLLQQRFPEIEVGLILPNGNGYKEVPKEMGLLPGQRVLHHEFGEGVIIGAATNGFVRAFFAVGERQVPVVSLTPIFARAEQIVRNVGSGTTRNRRAWLAYQAHALPLIESAAALTSAKIDLLPHQVVLTHRIATASPRRYLIADEVGLGKTIETALILRELTSRGELNRALMVVPAGLVNNWHRELNEVFNLDFEVFGSEGDVTDRKSNAFAKHDRLIASVDTLKRRPRVKRLMDAPMWDLVVFDEAQHLTASRSGGKTKKTDNYKLAEALKDHSRDLLLLSATPHQGDHYRFYMLMKLLDPTMFSSPDDMLENRHRLNSIIFRRTKADACRPDGSTLFARRWVHTESFIMSDVEREFYNELNVYLMDGFALAKQQGSKGRALGFVMTIFQKIAASSFAAVHRTLRRRLIALTVQEGLMHESRLDIDARDAAFAEARLLIMREFHLSEDRLGQIESERLLADLKRRIVKRTDDDELANLSSEFSSETATTTSEDSAIVAVELALPEERQRIRNLLTKYPPETETKVKNLINALGTLWQQDSSERVVIFATYLGSVEMLGEEIEKAYPGQGVVVLKGGDHGSKVAAEKRFKQPNGPRVMICTAAGREGINLQHARVLFNFDLPWNPMDLEQRIGRIHRYGQKHTAQVYNLVLSDTIEGKIFLLLDDKLKEIAKTLGKVDERGEVAEDLRSQILGQLSERLSYEGLYAQAISDPELKRTRLELEQALSNASEARNVVYELFQDLDGFSLNDYQPFSDITEGMDEIVRFVRTAAEEEGRAFRPDGDRVFVITTPDNGPSLRFTTDRDVSIVSEHVDLLGLDHPTVMQYMQRFRDLPDDQIGIRVRSEDGRTGVLSIWHVATQGDRGETRMQMLSLAVDAEGQRIPSWEKQADRLFQLKPVSTDREPQIDLLTETLEPMIQRELVHRGFLAENRGYDARLVGWVEVV